VTSGRLVDIAAGVDRREGLGITAYMLAQRMEIPKKRG
jgi:hypothetical protein